MSLTPWRDHVVHVELYGTDAKPTSGYARHLDEQFKGKAHVAVARGGLVEVRSDTDDAVTAEQIARALARADLPAAAVFERVEWSVGRS